MVCKLFDSNEQPPMGHLSPIEIRWQMGWQIFARICRLFAAAAIGGRRRTLLPRLHSSGARMPPASVNKRSRLILHWNVICPSIQLPTSLSSSNHARATYNKETKAHLSRTVGVKKSEMSTSDILIRMIRTWRNFFQQILSGQKIKKGLFFFGSR